MQLLPSWDHKSMKMDPNFSLSGLFESSAWFLINLLQLLNASLF